MKGSKMWPNMPSKRAAWNKDVNEAKVIEKKQIKEKLSALLLFALKAGHTFTKVPPFPSERTEVNHQRQL